MIESGSATVYCNDRQYSVVVCVPLSEMGFQTPVLGPESIPSSIARSIAQSMISFTFPAGINASATLPLSLRSKYMIDKHIKSQHMMTFAVPDSAVKIKTMFTIPDHIQEQLLANAESLAYIIMVDAEKTNIRDELKLRYDQIETGFRVVLGVAGIILAFMAITSKRLDST